MSEFVYVTYIRTTPQKLWEALTAPQFTKQYWFGAWQESAWAKGASWKLVRPNGSLADSGEVLEIDPPRRLVLKWRNEFVPDMTAEGHSRCVMELEQVEDATKLTITHAMERENSRLIAGVSNGWPKILSSLKSLLETGESLADTRADKT